MIDCIFTLDYEIYGNGSGALKGLVHEPTEKLREIFQKWNARFVVFVEVAELEQIEKYGADPEIGAVKRQLLELYQSGFEIGLHLHPQWCNASYSQGRWSLDLSEYNLCTLPPTRISEIVRHAVDYLRSAVDQPDFSPLSFRAGNWLFQPTRAAATVLAQHGIRIDSSVFKGGLQRNNTLDYRPALRNGDYWFFNSDATEPDPRGPWVEVPIYTEMVPFWRMPTSRRLGFGNAFGATSQSTAKKLNRLRDFMRFRYPLKLDFTRMTLNELTSMMDRVVRRDRQEPVRYRPIVVIGHTKDLVHPRTVSDFLSFLQANGITVTTFEGAYQKLLQGQTQVNSLPAVATRQNAKADTLQLNLK
jgi:hypothetical protein